MFLAFWPREPGQWYIRGRYGHVTALLHDDDVWTTIDVRRRGVDVRTAWRHDDVHDLISELTANCTILRYQALGKGHYLRPLSCVTFVRQMTGVPSRALFPDRLLADLLRNGAEIIHESAQAARVQRADPEQDAR